MWTGDLYLHNACESFFRGTTASVERRPRLRKVHAAFAADKPSVTLGLPETTRNFLLHEDKQPYTLFEHCSPQSVDGLFTRGSNLEPRGSAGSCASAGPLAAHLCREHMCG